MKRIFFITGIKTKKDSANIPFNKKQYEEDYPVSSSSDN